MAWCILILLCLGLPLVSLFKDFSDWCGLVFLKGSFIIWYGYHVIFLFVYMVIYMDGIFVNWNILAVLWWVLIEHDGWWFNVFMNSVHENVFIEYFCMHVHKKNWCEAFDLFFQAKLWTEVQDPYEIDRERLKELNRMTRS